MKFHASKSLLTAAAGAALTLCAFGANAKGGPNEGLPERQNPATAQYGDDFRNASVKSLFGASAASAGVRNLLVCGDSEPDEGEECDDGNTAAGDGCSATCTIEPGFDCSAAIAGVSSQNVITNGSFVDGDTTGWTEVSVPAGFGPISSGLNCGGCNLSSDDDNGWVWNGGLGEANVSSIARSITIPTNATTLQLDIWEGFCVPDGGSGDFVTVSIDGTELFNSGVCTTEAFYAQADTTIDLVAAGVNDGGVHTLLIEGNMDFTAGDPQTGSILVDNVRLNVPLVDPIPPIPSSCSAVICGDGAFPQFSAAGDEECDDGNTTAGDGCSASCTIEQPNFICDDPEPAAASGNDVADGGLEDGSPNADWVETGTQFDPICSQAFCGAALANDGAFYAWFGGSSLPNAQTLTQDVTISSTATDLTFDLLVGVCDSASDSLTVEIDGMEIYRYDCTADTSGYEPQSAALGAFADGGLHTVQFIGNTVAANTSNSNFLVDNIAIKDNVAFGGTPGACFELNAACDTVEQFSGGIPAGWTVINVGPAPADGWGASTDGICGTQNWSTTEPSNNVTGGAGIAACADSDATGQIEIDTGAGTALEMETYLCSPVINVSQVTDPVYSFLVNYQAADNDLNDNGTPTDDTDDFDDDFLEVLVGNVAPNSISVTGPAYTSLGNVFDHLDSTLALSEEAALNANLSAQNAETSAHVCFHYRGTYAWFAQIDNAGLRGSACVAPPDVDTDGVPDSIDNCVNFANADQRDTDADGHGNRCDADLNNDCIVNPVDLGIFRAAFFTADANSDLNGDGIVNPIDLGIFRSLFFQPPGLSGVGTLGCNPGP